MIGAKVNVVIDIGIIVIIITITIIDVLSVYRGVTYAAVIPPSTKKSVPVM